MATTAAIPPRPERGYPMPSALGPQASSSRNDLLTVRPAPPTNTLASTPRATRGRPPPPLMGSALVLLNDSAIHCFGGRLENRRLTNCHYVLDVERGSWEAIHPAEEEEGANQTDMNSSFHNNPKNMLSLSLTTDPVGPNTGSLSGMLSVQPQPRYFHTLNSFGTILILFGGMAKANPDDPDTANNLVALDDLHVFDTITQTWQQKHPPLNEHTPRARWAHLSTILDHYLIIIGGTDTNKAYVEDACVLDLHTWEWVASVQQIGQCGSYRTIAATGPSNQAAQTTAPTSPSFPSACAAMPQTSSSLSWPTTDSGGAEPIASLSMVLSRSLSKAIKLHESLKQEVDDDEEIDPYPKQQQQQQQQQQSANGKKSGERLLSGDLTPAFKPGSDIPSIYVYSNHTFRNLQRELKIISPHYTHASSRQDGGSGRNSRSSNNSHSEGTLGFNLMDKTPTVLGMDEIDLPPGLRFPQGHVYQNQLILTGTSIEPGKPPALAIYSMDLTTLKWTPMNTYTLLEVGSWNRTLLHPATGTLFVFGNYDSNAELDYSNRIQHHNHLMMIDLQAYGLYERPIPSFPTYAQDLGFDLLKDPSLNDMEIASMTGNLHPANSTVLAARWPEFATLLLSPPYIMDPLILELPVPDDVVTHFLYYLYTGALPADVTPGAADYLLILARRYELNGLYALTIDILHQTVDRNPIRVFGTALLAGELGLQARAVGLAVATRPPRQERLSLQPLGPPPPVPPARARPTPMGENGTSIRPPTTPRPPLMGHYSRDSVSTDGGESLVQQYQQGPPRQQQPPSLQTPHVNGDLVSEPLYLSNADPQARARKARAPPAIPAAAFQHHHQYYQQQPHMSVMSSGSSYYSGASGPMSPGYQSSGYHSQQISAGFMSPIRSGSDGAPSIYGDNEVDEMASILSGNTGQSLRTQEARRRLQMQMQMDVDQHAQQQQYLLEQHRLFEQQQQRQQELIKLEQQRQQQERYQARQQKLRQREKERLIQETNPAAMIGALDYHFGAAMGGGGGGGKKSKHTTAPLDWSKGSDPTIETTVSAKSNSSKGSNKSDEKKEKSLLKKLKPPKPTQSGADLMKSAGF
ncbi:hypothetical protein BGW42_001651 [Actinomortierella wolfii]|nr:hypothetical protein BGW42_001651 [Actinomortierella wolfii]